MKNIVEIYGRSVPRRIAVYGNLRFRSKRRSGRRMRRTAGPSWRRWARNCGRLGAWTAPAWSCDWVLYPETRHRPEVTSVQHFIFPPPFPERGRRPTCTPRHYPSALVDRLAISLFFSAIMILIFHGHALVPKICNFPINRPYTRRIKLTELSTKLICNCAGLNWIGLN